MTLKEAIERYTNNAKYERIHGSLQGCLDFRQLAEWLKDYEQLLEQIRDEYKTPCSLCRHIDDDSGLCDMCPAMPREKGENE